MDVVCTSPNMSLRPDNQDTSTRIPDPTKGCVFDCRDCSNIWTPEIFQAHDDFLREEDERVMRHEQLMEKERHRAKFRLPAFYGPSHPLLVESTCTSASERMVTSGTCLGSATCGEASALAPPEEGATSSKAAEPVAAGFESISMLHCVCPISHEIMRNPVICCDGHSYDRVNIERWFESHGTSPQTNAHLSSKALIPNHQLRAICEHVLAFQPRLHRF